MKKFLGVFLVSIILFCTGCENKEKVNLLGIEVGYQKRCLDRINEILSKESFDLINLSIHSNDYVDYYWPK